jgi:coenzyme PQQ precursor peptide PqqA
LTVSEGLKLESKVGRWLGAEDPAAVINIQERGDSSMKVWTRPDFKEVTLGCEINCYAPAEV